MKKKLNRREFIEFMTSSSLALSFSGSLLGLLNSSCSNIQTVNKINPITGIKPSSADDFLLAPGFKYEKLISYGQKINSKGDTFGFNNDFIATLPFQNSESEAYLWVNHESLDPLIAFSLNPVDYKKKT